MARNGSRELAPLPVPTYRRRVPCVAGQWGIYRPVQLRVELRTPLFTSQHMRVFAGASIPSTLFHASPLVRPIA